MVSNMDAELIKPSDAKSWTLCARRVWLDNKSDIEVPPVTDEFDLLVIKLGLDHEQAVFQSLSETSTIHTATSPEDTQRLINERVEVIYQAQLVDPDEGLIGFPDFLILNESNEYQAADAKLSLDVDKKEIQIQLGCYRRMLGSTLPAIVFLGNGEQATIGKEADPVTNKFIEGMRELLSAQLEPEARYSHSKCKICPYYAHCKPAFERSGELSLLYGVQARAALGLEDNGIANIEMLAKADPSAIPDVPYLKGFQNKLRAVSQARSYLSGEVIPSADVVLPDGNWVHFDIEDNPLTGNSEKHVYLWGFLAPNYAQNDFEYVWTNSQDEDEEGWRQFLSKVEEYREKYTNLILAHYSSHERSTIDSYAKRYDMEGNETVLYLLSEEGPLFDLQKPISNSLVLPLQGYGLKDICKHKDLVNFQWADEESGAQWSIVQFIHFLESSNPEYRAKLKSDILRYNHDDVLATRRLEEWLRVHFCSD
jgi:predicted RecB family nuclease